ncbi:hypothetical protein CBR_g38486 [Chara braunii]|uniref:Uncharacterized protein n=1 Tax=Chara braunii TaxID=69332 RepID=A0A388JP29_CHABU|nr:hypothetical protein CBR_g38486 [Chara braunii]|eukprot:GBG59462.1 hypothetical protein CBR_g38486 [Chara braunii]
MVVLFSTSHVNDVKGRKVRVELVHLAPGFQPIAGELMRSILMMTQAVYCCCDMCSLTVLRLSNGLRWKVVQLCNPLSDSLRFLV